MIEIVCVTLLLYTFVLFARVLWSWLPAPISGPARTVYTLLQDLTDPVLRPLSRMIPPIQAGAVAVDLSAMIAFVILLVLRQALCS